MSPSGVTHRRFVVLFLALIATAGLATSLQAQAHLPTARPALCGGSRASDSVWILTRSGAVVPAHLRGSTFAEVTMLGGGKAQAVWLTGMMFGHIEGLGPVRVRIDGSQASTVQIQSLTPGNPLFFPARADQTLYWRIEVLDETGAVVQTLINPEPMKISAEIQGIPPYGTPFPIQSDVAFVDLANPAETVAAVRGGQSLGVVENPGNLRIEPLSWQIDPAQHRFTITWRIENLTSQPLPIHWFAGGLHGVTLDPPFERFNVTLQNELTVTVSGNYDPNDGSEGLVFHATSVPGAVPAEAHYPFYLQDHGTPE